MSLAAMGRSPAQEPKAGGRGAAGAVGHLPDTTGRPVAVNSKEVGHATGPGKPDIKRYAKKMPKQKPGSSEQVVGTPQDFVAAVERCFGPIIWDLAATKENRVREVPWFGPGSPDGNDALSKPWHHITGGLLWLNPPYDEIAPWADKARFEGGLGARIALLVPLSSGNWARDHVHGKGQIEALNPRLKFVGHTQTYPKDLMLVLYGPGFTKLFDVWRWAK